MSDMEVLVLLRWHLIDVGSLFAWMIGSIYCAGLSQHFDVNFLFPPSYSPTHLIIL
jgi:hypothetical protein